MEVHQPIHGTDALRGLIEAVRQGGAYDALPSTLDPAQWAALAFYLQLRLVHAGDHAIRQGERERTLYFVESGTLTVHADDASGRRKLAVLAPGTVVGEGAFFSGQPRSATVVATREARLWSLTHAQFQALSRHHPAIALDIAMACAAVVVRRLAHTTMRIAVT